MANYEYKSAKVVDSYYIVEVSTQVDPGATLEAGSLVARKLDAIKHPLLACWPDVRFQNSGGEDDYVTSVTLAYVVRAIPADHEIEPLDVGAAFQPEEWYGCHIEHHICPRDLEVRWAVGYDTHFGYLTVSYYPEVEGAEAEMYSRDGIGRYKVVKTFKTESEADEFVDSKLEHKYA